jgi:hypothetical protein
MAAVAAGRVFVGAHQCYRAPLDQGEQPINPF